jgi:DNA-binding transcriptional LysR family regulator
MDRLGDRNTLEAFVRSVDLGGFSAAARQLGISPSAVSKLVSRIESSLGARLVHRTTRKLALSEEGELFLARARRILEEFEDAENELGNARERPCGRVRVHVGVGFAMHQFIPALPAFMQSYPEVRIDLLIEDRNVDLTRENVDVSVRPGPVADDSVVVRELFDFQRIVCASPEYLRRNGNPALPENLHQHNCLVISGFPKRGQWRFFEHGRSTSVEVPSAIHVNNADAVLKLAIAGAGIARLNEFIVAEALRAGQLVPVLRDFHCAEPEAMLALFPAMRQRLPRVAAMLDFLADRFASRPWRTTASRVAAP